MIDDSPLEGDHWQTWPENEEDSEEDEEDDDDDDYELNQDNIAAATTATTPHKKTPFGDLSNFKFDFTSKLKLDKREDQEGLNHLVSQQYWRSEYRLPRQDITHVNLLQKPCQMSDALERIIYSEAERNQLKTISEANIIREVLSLLRGYRSVVYVYQEGQFVVSWANECVARIMPTDTREPAQSAVHFTTPQPECLGPFTTRVLPIRKHDSRAPTAVQQDHPQHPVWTDQPSICSHAISVLDGF